MIYLIKAEETNLYKIGYTAGTTEDRIKGLQTGCPYKLSTVIDVDGSLQKEKCLQKTFEKYKKQGEWFEFNEKTLKKVCEEMKTKKSKGGVLVAISLVTWRDVWGVGKIEFWPMKVVGRGVDNDVCAK